MRQSCVMSSAWSQIGSMQTERLRLEPIGLEHARLLVVLDSDAEVMHYINGGRPTPETEVDETIRRSIGHRWVAFTRDNDAFAGWFEMRPTGEDEYELGYRLRRHVWGLGLATEASRMLIDTAFTRLNPRRRGAPPLTVTRRSPAG